MIWEMLTSSAVRFFVAVIVVISVPADVVELIIVMSAVMHYEALEHLDVSRIELDFSSSFCDVLLNPLKEEVYEILRFRIE